MYFILKVHSEQVANGIERVGGDEVKETVKFVRMMDKFFDCLNVTNLTFVYCTGFLLYVLSFISISSLCSYTSLCH